MIFLYRCFYYSESVKRCQSLFRPPERKNAAAILLDVYNFSSAFSGKTSCFAAGRQGPHFPKLPGAVTPLPRHCPASELHSGKTSGPSDFCCPFGRPPGYRSAPPAGPNAPAVHARRRQIFSLRRALGRGKNVCTPQNPHFSSIFSK